MSRASNASPDSLHHRDCFRCTIKPWLVLQRLVLKVDEIPGTQVAVRPENASPCSLHRNCDAAPPKTCTVAAGAWGQCQRQSPGTSVIFRPENLSLRSPLNENCHTCTILVMCGKRVKKYLSYFPLTPTQYFTVITHVTWLLRTNLNSLWMIGNNWAVRTGWMVTKLPRTRPASRTSLQRVNTLPL